MTGNPQKNARWVELPDEVLDSVEAGRKTGREIVPESLDTVTYPRDGAGMGGNRRIERRRNEKSGDSPMEILTRLPAVVVLERRGSYGRYRAGRHHLVREYGVCRDGGLPAGQLSGGGVG